MNPSECVAMILAGGQGSRLGVLTKKLAKPAVHFGGKYRIIDFTLSNCVNSDIDAVGILTQYQPLELNTYIGNGQPWDLDRNYGGVNVLPPYMKREVGEWYKGTANAIYQNIPYLRQFRPKNVLVLSGDHIYQMNYAHMIKEHIRSGAAATIAVIEVEISEASRFGIMSRDEDGRIVEFEEKPKNPKSNLASMGIYVFNYEILEQYLTEDEKNSASSNDFGKDIIPTMLANGEKLQSFLFEGYWRDVGTIESLWQCHMDLLSDHPEFQLEDGDWRFYSRNPVQPPHYISYHANVVNSMVTEGCNVYGDVENSILFNGVHVFNEAVIKDSIIMPNVRIGYGCTIEKAIIAPGTVIGNFATVGKRESKDNPYASEYATDGITVIGADLYIDREMEIFKGSMIDKDQVEEQKGILKGKEGNVHA